MVFNPKGEPVEVDYISPIVNYDTYKIIFEDRTEVIATANHLWAVEEKTFNGKGKSKIYKTKTVETKDIKIKYGGSYATKIKLSEPLQFEEKQLPIDPYTLGAWLGDGRSNRGTICTHFEDHEIWENIEKNGYKLSFQNNKIETIKYYTVLGLRTRLGTLNLIDNKHIPEIYLRSSIEQRMELLKGLMDTDGCCTTREGNCIYSSASKQLILGVLNLVNGLGFKGCLSDSPDCNGKTHYRVWFRTNKIVFNLTRKIKLLPKNIHITNSYRFIRSIEKIETEPCRCISIKDNDHLFLITENLITTHNTKKDQARIVFTESVNMVRQSPILTKYLKKRKSDLYFPLMTSVFSPLASDSNSLDGLNSHCIIMDELHAIKDRQLYEVLKQSMSARRQPLLVMITTAGTVRECIFDDMYFYANEVLNDIRTDDRFLPILYELDDRNEWIDWKCWQKANPGLGTIKKITDLTEQVERAKVNPKEVKGVLCKHFNIRENEEASWISLETIKNEAKFNIKELENTYGIGGVDLSDVNDLTCATLMVIKPDNPVIKYVIQQYFIAEDLLQQKIKEDNIPYDLWHNAGLLTLCSGASVNYTDVTDWFLKMRDIYGIQGTWIGYDRWGTRYWLDEIKQHGFRMLEVIQGPKTLSTPMKFLEGELIEKHINYNNNPMLVWCLSNTIIERDKNGNISPTKKIAKRRIDGAVSLLIAYTTYLTYKENYMNLIL